MVKKSKNRQTQESPTIQNGGDSAESGDQKKTCSPGCRCSHIQKAICLASIKRNLKNGCLAGDCPGCIKDGVKTEESQSGGLWLCLQCGHQGCGRSERQHALNHYKLPHSDPHCVAVNTTSWNVWCYSCVVELPSEYRKKLQECVKYLKNLDCPSPARVSVNSCAVGGNKEVDALGSSPMPLSDVTNISPHGIQRTLKKKMVSLPRVRGLQNLGNTCFFNSVMQCLAQTPHLLELLQDSRTGGGRFQLPGGKGLLSSPPQQGEGDGDDEAEELDPLEGNLTKWGTLTETLANTLEELRQDDASAVNPQRLLNKLTTKCPQFGGGDQHDAHELLRHLLDEVRTEDLKRYWIAILDQFGLSRHDTNETVDGSVRARVRAYGRQAGELLPLLPDPVFRGTLVSTVECQDCLHSTQRSESFYDLSLPVTTNKPQPPIMRRKAGGEDSFDVCGNMTSDTPSKHQLKKERRQQRKGRKKQQGHQQSAKGAGASAGTQGTSASEPSIAEEAAGNSAESEQSDADVEDNVEQDVSLQEINSGGLVVNGEMIPSIGLKLCNGNISDNENVEIQRTSKERVANGTIYDEDVICPAEEKLCNGFDNNKNFVVEGITIDENGIVKHPVDKHRVEGKMASHCKRISEEGEEAMKTVESEMKEIKGEKTGVSGSEESVNSTAFKGNRCVKESKNFVNGFVESSFAEDNDDENEVDGNKSITENGLIEKICNGNDSIDILDISDSLFLQLAKEEDLKDELSLTISTTGQSPGALGSPSSVSSDINTEVSVSHPLSANNWHAEDSDRPCSRIAFCLDDDLVTSSDNRQQTESTLNNFQNTPGGENTSKDTAAGDSLVKEMTSLSLGHEERQSPSHWDTCSAHSLEDAVKESKLVVPVEPPLCNGVSQNAEPESLDGTDKSGTLAPRYQCGDKECSIESCLNQFTLLELMTGSCKVICENCTERINKGKKGKMVATNSTKQYLVSNPPAVLVLHLKRFEVHQNMFRKTPRHVSFPMMLDIAPICNTKCRELPTIRKGQTKVLYSLYGVVQHYGTLHGGHYSAYVKVRAPVRQDDLRWCFLATSQCSQQLEELSKGTSMPTEPLPGKWYHVSDSRVNEVNEERVLRSQAYLLFYERVW